MIIRKANIKDARKIAELYKEIWKVHSSLDEFWLPEWAAKSTKSFGDLVTEKNIDKRLYYDAKQTIKDKELYTFIAEENKEVLGYINFWIEKNLSWFRVKKYGYIDECIISTKHRGKGIARKLLGFAESFLKNKRINYLMLKTTLKNKAAQKAWQHLGFKKEMILWKKRI